MADIMVRRVLMVAYHFPPINMSSGYQRTLRFAQYLPESGWEPRILTVHTRAYPTTGGAESVPADLHIRRAFALDSARHLAVFGRHSRLLSLPDRWWTWWLGAVPAGLAMIREWRPDVIWSTYPIATAHMIGYTLRRLSGIPWVADFRDPMAQPGYPEDALTHRSFRWIEERTLHHCQSATFTTPGALRMYRERYAKAIAAERLVLLENGYDEASFVEAEQRMDARRRIEGPMRIVHSGTVYASERDPRALFRALATLKRAGRAGPADFRIVLRATGADALVRDLVAREGVGDMVAIEPPIDYRSALAEMLGADGLLILQAANCNDQIPAKLYECLRAGRPVLALTDPAGDTATALARAGIDTIAPLDDDAAIATALMRFVDLIRTGRAPMPAKSRVAASSRRARAVELARVLDAACA